MTVGYETGYTGGYAGAAGPGFSWSIGGLLGTGLTIVERAWVTVEKRNLAATQLYGGGDVERSTAGFYVDPSTVSTLTYDTAEPWHGRGSIRWGVNDTGTYLYAGWPSGLIDDLAPLYALHVVPGLQYSLGLYAKADASFSTQLEVQALDKSGSLVGSLVSSGAKTLTTSWQLISATITIPAGGVYLRARLVNSAAATTRLVWIDAIQLVNDAVVDVTPRRPGGVAMNWVQLRGATELDDPIVAANSPDQTVTIWDEEVPPGYTVTYRARNVQPKTASVSTQGSDVTPYVQTMLTPPGSGVYVLKDLYSALDNLQVAVTTIAEDQHAESTSYQPLRPVGTSAIGQRTVVVTDFLGGHDGTLTIAVRGDEEWSRLERLLAATKTLWLVFPHFGARYITVTGRSWGRRHFFPGECEDLAGWLRTLTINYVETDRPEI